MEKKKKLKMVSKVPTEDHEQMKLASWLDKSGIKFFAIPNGGSRNLVEAVKLKRCGVKSGVPDICIPIPSGGYHGLYIEIKRVKGGVVSPTQVEWIEYLVSQGYYAVVAYGFEEAVEVVNKYLAFTPLAA